MRLLNNPTDLETACTETVLARFGTRDQCVYGGGPLVAGFAFDQIVEAYRASQYLGVIGATIPERLVTSFPGPLRANLGAIWNLGERFMVADALSVQWSLHLGVNVKQSPYLGWLTSKEEAENGFFFFDRVNTFYDEIGGIVVFSEGVELPPGFEQARAISIGSLSDLRALTAERFVIVDSVGAALCLAILDEPALLFATHAWGNTTSLDHNLLVRWAHDANMVESLCYNYDEIRKKDLKPVSRDLVDVKKEQTRKLLTEVALKKSENALVSAFGRPSPASAREFKLGTKFNPSTHYDASYFGGGIKYTRADGSPDLYQGPAHAWGGFAQVAKWLMTLAGDVASDRKPTLLDVGCGSGDFVGQAVNAGFDAWGVDISTAAREQSQVKDRIIIGDVTDPSLDLASRFVGKVDLITALDFWEHVFVADIDRLAQGVRDMLRVGGHGFFCICTRSSAEQDWTMEPGQIITKENSWLLVSGHVTIRRWRWWASKFTEHGLEPDMERSQLFQVLREEDPGFSNVKSWTARHTLFVTRTR